MLLRRVCTILVVAMANVVASARYLMYLTGSVNSDSIPSQTFVFF